MIPTQPCSQTPLIYKSVASQGRHKKGLPLRLSHFPSCYQVARAYFILEIGLSSFSIVVTRHHDQGHLIGVKAPEGRVHADGARDNQDCTS